MNVATAEQLAGRVVWDITTLPEEDLTLVAELVDYLKLQRRAAPRTRLTAGEMRTEARRRAQL